MKAAYSLRLSEVQTEQNLEYYYHKKITVYRQQFDILIKFCQILLCSKWFNISLVWLSKKQTLFMSTAGCVSVKSGMFCGHGHFWCHFPSRQRAYKCLFSSLQSGRASLQLITELMLCSLALYCLALLWYFRFLTPYVPDLPEESRRSVESITSEMFGNTSWRHQCKDFIRPCITVLNSLVRLMCVSALLTMES